MSIGEDFAAALAKADVQKARAARVQYLGTLTLAGLEREEDKEIDGDTYDPATEQLYKALKGERAKQEAASLASLEQPDAIMRQYVRGLRDGVYSEKFQPVIQQIWTDAYRKQSTRSAAEKAGALASGFGSALVEAAPMFSRGLGAAGAVGVEMTPAAVATGAAAAELGGAESMRLLKGIPRLAEEDVSKEGLQKIFDRDLKELSDIEQVRRYEGKFLKDMAAKAPGLAQTVDTIKATLTEDDLKTVDDLSNIFDPTELLPIGFVVTKVGKAFGLAAKTAGKSKVLARTFKTAEEAALEAERLNSTFNKVRKAVGTAMAGAGERVAKSTAGAPVSTFVGGLAAGLPPETAFVAAAVSSYIPRGLRRGIGNVIEATGNVIAKDLPVPWERARQGLVNAGRQALESGAEGMAGNAIFALGASSPEEAGGLLGTGAGLGGATGLTAEGVQRGLGLFDLAANRFNPAERPAEATRQATSRYNEGLDDIHTEAVAKLDNASANAIEQMRNTIVGPEGRLYVVDTPEQAAKIASFYTGQTVSPDQVQSNGFSFLPDQTKQGVGVAVVFSKGEAFAHEPGHLVYNAAKISADPEMRKMAKEIDQKAREVLPKGSDRFNALRDYYNSLLPKGAKRLSGNRVIEEFIVEHFTAVVGGAPLIKFGGDVPLSKSIYDFALTLAEKTGAYQSGLDFSGRSPVTSQTLPIKPSPQLAKLVENMLAARQLDLNKNVPSTLVNGLPGATPAQATAAPAPAAPTPAGVQNVEVVTPPAPQPGFKKGDPIGTINNPQGELVFSGAKVWADSQGPTVRIEGVDTNGNIVRADVPRVWLESQRATATPPVDVGTLVPVPAEQVGRPATTPSPQAPRPAVAGVTEQQRTTVAGTATPELQAQNEQALIDNLRKPVQFEYLSAEPSAKSGDAAVRLRERQLADRNEQEGVPNPFRAIFGKVTVPTSIYTPKNGKRSFYAFSPDKLIRNIDQLRGWYLEKGDKAAADRLYSPEFQQQVRAYLDNQSNGYRGDGERIVRPADTDPNLFPPENPSYTPTKLDEGTRNYINFLMGLDPVSSLAVREAWNVFKLAELNGFKPATVIPSTVEGRTKTYFNPMVQQMRDAGFDGTLNSVIEQLRLERIVSPVTPRPDLASIKPAVQGSVQAGFMPEAAKRDTLIRRVGVADEDGVRSRIGTAIRHKDFGKIDENTARWRFDPATGELFWWGTPNEVVRENVLSHLARKKEAVVKETDISANTEALRRAEPGFTPAYMPEGRRELVNVGLKIGDKISLTKEDVIKAFADEGITLENVQVRESGTEPTVIAAVRGADKAAIDRASNTLQQDAIAVYNPANDSGYLAGPRPENFGGKFLKEYFLMPEEGPAMMPKAKKPLKGSLGKGDITFFHYSDTPNKGAIDPKFFGKSGVTGAREQAGLPRAYAYAEGSTLGQDAGLVDARKHYYEGTAPKGKIYDGVEDVLGYGDMANRAKADQMLIDKGFVGIYREGLNDVKQLEFFRPMNVTEAEKPESTGPLAEEAMPILPPLALEEIDYAAQDREFARKKAAGEPLYMPKARGITSQLEATLQAIPEKASRQQIEAALRDGVKQKGQLVERPVKAEEMRDIVDQTGRSFEEFLKESPQATRDEMLDFVRQNQIQVTETRLGEPAGKLTVVERDGKYDVLRPDGTVWGEGLSSLEDARRAAARAEKLPEAGMQVRFARYQEPGGENYREVLYTLPDNPDAKRAAQEKYNALVADGYPLAEALRMAEQMTPGFRSTHFADVRNYLAHARVNERQTPNGETMLFVEEIQSDLHQKARTEGYREPLTPDEESALLEQQMVLNREYAAAVKADNVPEMERLEAEKQALRNRFKRAKFGIPDAPFKKSWHEFVFKNLLRDAVEQGKDWLGWTTGEQQAARYDLSKQIAKVQVMPSRQAGRERLWAYDHDGKMVLNQQIDAGTADQYVGKEVAKKLYEAPELTFRDAVMDEDKTYREVSGIDLKVGGEGMRGFYDDILPRFVDKYLKKYGIKTETISVPEAGDVHAIRITPELRADVLEKGQPAYMPDTVKSFTPDAAAAFMPAPRVNLEDYIGRDVVTLTTDRLDVGFKDVGPTGAKKPTRKQAQGGRGFPLLYTGLGWAFSDPGSAKRFLTRLQATADGDTALVATAVLGEHNVLNSPFGQHAVAMAYRHAVDSGVLKLKDVDRSIRTIFSRAAASTLGDPDMKKIKTLEDYERASENWPFSFGATRELAKRLDAAELKIPAELRQAVGLDALSLARSISDPELAGLPNFTLVSLMEIPVDQTPVKDDIHFSYPYTVKGKLLGFLKDPIAADKLISSPRVRKGGQLTAQPMMTVMPSLDLLKPTELNPEPQQVLAEARLEYAKP